MRRLARHLFTLWTAASLVLCVGTAGLWAWSFWRAESLTFWRVLPPLQPPGNDEITIKAERGHVEVKRFWQVWEAEEYSPHWWPRVGQGWEVIYWGEWIADNPNYTPGPLGWLYSRPVLGFRGVAAELAQGTPPKPGWVGGVVVPFWFLLVVFAATPVWWLSRRRRSGRRYRLRMGLCLACGYDLRATPGRCPECGAVAAAAAPSPSPA